MRFVDSNIFLRYLAAGDPARSKACFDLFQRAQAGKEAVTTCEAVVTEVAYVLRSAGRDPDEAMLAWMRDFSERTGRPFFYEQAGERFGFGPPQFQLEMSEKVARGEALW